MAVELIPQLVEAQDIPSLQEGIDLVFGWCLIDEPYCAY